MKYAMLITTVSKFLKKYSIILPLFLMLGVFLLAIRPDIALDAWFHIFVGKYYLQYGVFYKDIFSYTAFGRGWVPSEWLYQVVIYLYAQVFGIAAVPLFSAFFTSVCMGILYKMLRLVFRLPRLLCVWTVAFYFLYTYIFFINRPQVFGVIFFIINLGLILQYIYYKKNLLFFSIPLTLLWANIHGTVALNIYLYVSYTILMFMRYLVTHNDIAKKQVKMLGIYTLAVGASTILPPLGIRQYQLLYLFWHYHARLNDMITEWQSITQNYTPLQVDIFILLAIVFTIIIALITIRKRLYLQTMWLLPLLTFLVVPFIAFRNVIYANLVLAIFLGFIISQIPWHFLKPKIKAGIIIFFAVTFLSFSYYLLLIKNITVPIYTPFGATAFIQKYNPQGNMFNEIADGAYLLYNLYPTRKVFIDLRFDLYACCEIADYDKLLQNANKDNKGFSPLVYTYLLNKYPISYVLAETKKGSLSGRIAEVLQNDPQWDLVYWDDVSEIFVKKDGRNTTLLKQFGTQAATPFEALPFAPDKAAQAFQEYQKMIQVADSAVSRRGLAYTYVLKKDYPNAELQLEKAISLKPTYDVAYADLAELVLHDGNPSAAISLEEAAQRLNPTRGTTYVRLAQLYVTYQHNFQKAQSILQYGLQQTQNQQERTLIEQTLLQLQRLEQQ